MFTIFKPILLLEMALANRQCNSISPSLSSYYGYFSIWITVCSKHTQILDHRGAELYTLLVTWNEEFVFFFEKAASALSLVFDWLILLHLDPNFHTFQCGAFHVQNVRVFRLTEDPSALAFCTNRLYRFFLKERKSLGFSSKSLLTVILPRL